MKGNYCINTNKKEIQAITEKRIPSIHRPNNRDKVYNSILI